jgi:hypothetical protein
MEENYDSSIEPKYYNYKAKELLSLYFYQDIRSFNKIKLCAYKVNNNGQYPFLNFLLTKRIFWGTLLESLFTFEHRHDARY